MKKKHAIRHRVEHTKNKHSRAVFRDGTIVIRLANGLTKNEEQEHIKDLLKRMTQHVVEEQKKTIINPFQKMLDGAERTTITLASGKRYIFTLRPGKKTKVVRTKTGWTVYIAPRIRRSGLHKLLWKILAEQEHARIEQLVHSVNADTYGVHISSVKLRIATTQWGSCSPSGVIMLNAALLFVPTSILKYVIVHELAHRKRADHSKVFWDWVEWAMPHYNKHRSALQDCRLPTL